jgi:hypothetical protein
MMEVKTSFLPVAIILAAVIIAFGLFKGLQDPMSRPIEHQEREWTKPEPALDTRWDLNDFIKN